jgi:hypothetical protein
MISVGTKRYNARVIGDGAGVVDPLLAHTRSQSGPFSHTYIPGTPNTTVVPTAVTQMRASDEMEKIESPPQAPAPVLSEAAGRPMADDVLTRDVYVEEHAVDGQAFHSRHAVVLRTRACLGAMNMAVLVFGCWILKHLAHQNAETHLFGWAVAGIFVLLGTCSGRPVACRCSRPVG